MMVRILCLSALSLAMIPAQAGTIQETISRHFGGAGGQAAPAVSTILTYAQDGRMRVETKPGDTLMIFKDETIYSVNTKDKSYFVMDRAAMKRMADQISPALKQMQEQMAKMPPEQRAQMEKMMGQSMMPKPKTQEIRKTARTDKIGAYSCNYVEVYEDSAMSDEMCVVAPNALKGSQELLDAAMKMSALMKEAFGSMDAPWLKQMVDNQVAKYEKVGGIPVLTRHYASGKPVYETTLKSIRSEGLPAALFDVPAGYTKKDMMAQR